jgi:lysozyme
MAFNLGEWKLRGFKLMKAAIDSRDWEQAANEAKDSLWYRQVGPRAERIVSAIREG